MKHMKKCYNGIHIFIVAFLFLNILIVDVSAGGFFEGHVEKVIEGNMVILRGGTVVQYMGIDVPQMRDANPFFRDIATAALKYNKQLVEKKTVRLEIVDPQNIGVDDSKKYAYIFIGGQMINALMLKKGYALVSKAFPPEDKYQDFFIRSQNEAVACTAGIWKKLSSSQKKKGTVDHVFQ
ncbi:MAG: thermonuclease family protein [Candidatus Omnitrophica bacterium]|nr:thermonuclease family protein [Candidatus Omnitrophota bacterium]